MSTRRSAGTPPAAEPAPASGSRPRTGAPRAPAGGAPAIDTRLNALEERLSALETRLQASGAQTSLRDAAGAPRPDADRGADRWWLLSGLRRQLPDGEGGVAFGGIFAGPAGELRWQIGLTQGDLLDAPWEGSAPVFAALGHPVRLRLLRALLDGIGAVQALAALEGLGTTGQLYHHLRDLEAAGWVQTTRRGQYAVPPARVIPLLAMLAAARS